MPYPFSFATLAWVLTIVTVPSLCAAKWCPATGYCYLQPLDDSADISGSITVSLTGSSATQFTVAVSGNDVPSEELYLKGMTYGDLSNAPTTLGSTYGGTCNSCRASGVSQVAGNLKDGATIGSGSGSHSFTDTLNLMRGPNSLVGRGLLLKTKNKAIAACVLGRATDQAHSTSCPDTSPKRPLTCSFVSQTTTGTVSGSASVSSSDGATAIAWSLSGLSAGDHGFRVLTSGTIPAPSGNSPFYPACGCRSSGQDAAGNLFSTGTITAGSNGNSEGSKTDSVVEASLYSDFGIVGRALVVDTAPGSSNRVASCVLGYKYEEGPKDDDDNTTMIIVFSVLGFAVLSVIVGTGVWWCSAGRKKDRRLGKQFITDEKESKSLEMAKDRKYSTRQSFDEGNKKRGIESSTLNPVTAHLDADKP